jgi:quercetin dioxygenase-like cupin family protein
MEGSRPGLVMRVSTTEPVRWKHSSTDPERGSVELLSTQPTNRGPAENFAGAVWFNVIVRGEGESRLSVNLVRFEPGARTAWHSHGVGQTLHVTEGIGVVATRDTAIVMRPGDTVHTPPGEEHWHAALPDHFMAHLAMWEGTGANWGAHVTDDEYAAATRNVEL